MQAAEVISRTLVTAGGTASAMFGMDAEDAAHVFSVLRGTLYSRKELAVCREYSSNAWDAHKASGIGDRPIKVVLPTEVEPTFVVRDYGVGLCQHDVLHVYNKYGKSSKRDKPEEIGFLGFGSKSAYCYSDTFTVTSWHGGTKSVYVSAIDESNIGRTTLLHEEPCDPAETGVEVRVPVRYGDIQTFRDEARYLFRFMTPTPDVNVVVEPLAVDERVNGYILHTGEGVWTAIMGPVPYRLDLTKMMPELRAAGLEDVARSVTGGLFFPLGEVSFAAHREELEYTSRTKAAVVARLKLLFSEITGEMDAVTSDPDSTTWAKRLAVHEFRRKTGLPVPGKYAEWRDEHVEVYTHDRLRDGDGNPLIGPDGKPRTSAPTTFRVMGFPYKKGKYGHVTTERLSKISEWPRIDTVPTSRLLVRDTDLAMKGYHLTVDDHVVVPTSRPYDLLSVVGTGSGDDPIHTELASYVEAAGLTGIPVLRFSEMAWDPKAPSAPRPTKTGSAFNVKHTVRNFVLRDEGMGKSPYSQNWNVVDRVPDETDVYVILSHFQVCGHSNFYHDVGTDRRLVKFLGGTFPTVVGVKSLQRDPVHKVKGTPYAEWRKDILCSLLAENPVVQARLVAYDWSQIGQKLRYYGGAQGVIKALRVTVAPDHPLLVLHENIHAGTVKYNKGQDNNTLVTLYSSINRTPEENEAVPALASMYARYPLLDPKFRGPDFGVLSSDAAEVWIEYILSVDAALVQATALSA